MHTTHIPPFSDGYEIYEQWHNASCTTRRWLEDARARTEHKPMKDSADANVATNPRTLCSLGKAKRKTGFKGLKFGPTLPSLAIVQLSEARTNCPWCGCTLAGTAITRSTMIWRTANKMQRLPSRAQSQKYCTTMYSGTPILTIPTVRSHRYL